MTDEITHEALARASADDALAAQIATIQCELTDRPPLTAEAFDKMIAESAAYQALVDRCADLETKLLTVECEVDQNAISIAILGGAIQAIQK